MLLIRARAQAPDATAAHAAAGARVAVVVGADVAAQAGSGSGSSGGEAAILARGVHVGRVQRAMGGRCRGDQCEPGCAGAHAWFLCRFVPAAAASAAEPLARVDLIVDLSARNRLLSWDALRAVASRTAFSREGVILATTPPAAAGAATAVATPALEDAWLLVGGGGKGGGPAEKQQRPAAMQPLPPMPVFLRGVGEGGEDKNKAASRSDARRSTSITPPLNNAAGAAAAAMDNSMLWRKRHRTM
jgi:hypothetical protein